MATTLTLDTLDGMELQSDQGLTRYVRPGIIRDIGTGDDYKLLFDALAVSGMPANGDALHSSYPNLILTRRRLTPLGPSTARVELIYETPAIQGFSSWVIRVASRLVSYRTNRVLGTNQLIEVGLSGLVSRGVARRPLEIDQLLPMTEVSGTAVHTGSTVTDPEPYCGGVNDASYRGRGAGFWLLAEGGRDTTVYSGYTTTFCTLLCRNFADWSEWAFATDIDGNPKYKSAKVDEAKLLPYARGIINGAANAQTDGFARVGPYPTIDFSTVLTGLV